MVDFESGTPAWDLGIMLTRHGTGYSRNQNGTTHVCARVAELHRTATTATARETGQVFAAETRLELALAVECTCGAGDSDAETTSYRSVKE